MLKLPEDILLDLFQNWLVIEDIIRLDSALCERASRATYLRLIPAALVEDKCKVEWCVDLWVRWRVERKIPIMSPLTVQKLRGETNSILNFQDYEIILADVPAISVNSIALRVAVWLESVAPCFRNLTNICAVSIEPGDVAWLSAMLSQNTGTLTDVKIDCPAAFDHTQPIVQFLYKSSSLEILQLSNCTCLGMETIVQNNINIRYIDLDGCYGMNEAAFASLLALPNLVTLHLAYNDFITGDTAAHIASTKLESFKLVKFFKLTEENLVRILRTVPNKAILWVHINYLMDPVQWLIDNGMMGFAKLTQYPH